MQYSSASFKRYFVLLVASLTLLGACSDSDSDADNPDTGVQADTNISDSTDAPDSDDDDQDAGDISESDSDDDSGDISDDDSGDISQGDTDTEDSTDGDLVPLKVIAFNDLHGRLAAPAGTIHNDGDTLDAGGIAYMKAWADELTQNADNSILVAAGDMVGASPLMSAMFHDEPTIVALNMLGLEATAVGNHEFDAGWEELLRLQNGGCHADGCDWIDPYEGADFPILAANVITETGDTLLPSTVVKTYEGVKVGFIGLTLEGTGRITRPSATEGLTFNDEVQTIDGEVEKLQNQGIEAIVVLIHEGGQPTGEQPNVSDCGDMQGPIVDIVSQSSSAVDVFVSGHTHQTYICDIEGRLVTSGFSYGRILTEIDLMIDPTSGDVTEKSALNHVVRNDEITADSDLSDFVADLTALAADADPVIGQITQTIDRTIDENGESPLGELVADSHLWATSSTGEGNAQIAMANSGGIRANLSSSGATPENPGDITFSDAFDVLPFGNTLVTVTLTGAQVHELLEQQFTATEYVIVQVSEGFTYSYTVDATVGNHVDPDSIKLNGVTIDPTEEYRITVNSYMAEGGDFLAVLGEGTDRTQGPPEVDTFAQYLLAHSPVAKPSPDRITRLDP